MFKKPLRFTPKTCLIVPYSLLTLREKIECSKIRTYYSNYI